MNPQRRTGAPPARPPCLSRRRTGSSSTFVNRAQMRPSRPSIFSGCAIFLHRLRTSAHNPARAMNLFSLQGEVAVVIG